MKKVNPAKRENQLFALCSVIVFALPFFPYTAYWNTAYWGAAAVLLLTLGLGFHQGKRQSGKSISWVDLGFLLLLLATTMSVAKSVIWHGTLPSRTQNLNFLFFSAIYLLFSFRFRPGQINWEQWLRIPFFFLLLISSFVGYQLLKVDFNYGGLTNALSYSEGIGNISQVAMYLAFYGVIIFTLAKKQWQLLTTTALLLVLAYFLDSKMLAIAIILCVGSRLLAGVKLNKQVTFTTAGVLGGALLLFFWQPAFLAGRLNLWSALGSNMGLEYLSGVGIGNFSSYINHLFVHGQAINTTGEINHLCFNDFLQVFLELGLLGLSGLACIFFGLSQQKTFGLVLAIGLVLGFMFPLQYLESAILLACCCFVIQMKTNPVMLNLQLPARTALSGILVVIILNVGYTSYLQYNYQQWYLADQQILSDTPQNGLAGYEQSASHFLMEDEYFLRYGLHLKKDSHYNDALRMLNRANTLNPSYNSYIYLGDCYFEMGFHQEAIENYQLAQAVRPKHLYPTYKMIFSWNNNNKRAKAKSYWQEHKDDYSQLYSYKMQVMYKEIEELLSL